MCIQRLLYSFQAEYRGGAIRGTVQGGPAAATGEVQPGAWWTQGTAARSRVPARGPGARGRLDAILTMDKQS